MQLEHEFVVPVPVADAWEVLLDIERIAPCMPGATLDAVEGDTFTGRVKVKLGPIQVTYTGRALFVEKDEAGRRAVIEASAKETRGAGTAAATIRATLVDQDGSSTRVTVATDLNITGKPAQFGRGVMADVGGKLIGQFADCLADQISAGAAPGRRDAPGTEPPGPVRAESREERARADGEPPAREVAAPLNGSGEAPVGGSAEAAAAAAAAGIPGVTAGPGPVSTGTPSTDAWTPAGAPPPRRPARSVPEAIDLLETARGPLLERLAPVIAGLLSAVVVWWLLRRSRRR